jgi:dienelactone hydrolase
LPAKAAPEIGAMQSTGGRKGDDADNKLIRLLAAPKSMLDPAEVFSYDASKPLAVRQGSVEEVGMIHVAEISYDSAKTGRVPGYLVLPPGKGPFAALVYMHWGQGNKSEWLAEGVEMAKRGAVSLMIDAPYLRPNAAPPTSTNAYAAERDSYIQLVVDLRRAVDVLVARGDVDPKRIGYVGHSLGATWGGPLAAVEKRLKVLVLMGGLASLTSYDDDSLYAAARRASTPRNEFQKYAAAIEPYNPERFVANTAPAKIYFQWAKHDMFISEHSAAAYYGAVGGPKEQRWYFTSHEFNDALSCNDRREWLTKELGLRPAPEIGAIESDGEHKGEIYGGIYPADNKPIWFSAAPRIMNHCAAAAWAEGQGSAFPAAYIWLWEPNSSNSHPAWFQRLSDGYQDYGNRLNELPVLCVLR